VSGDEPAREDPLAVFAARDYDEVALDEEVLIRLHDDLRPGKGGRVPWNQVTMAATVMGSGTLYVAGLGVLALVPAVAGLVVTLILADAERREDAMGDVPAARIELHLEARGVAVQRFGVTRFVPWSELASFDLVPRQLPGTVEGTEHVHVVQARTRSRGSLDLLVFRDEPSAVFVQTKLMEHWERFRRFTPAVGYR
jgi:hypothetical protein